MPRSKKKVVKKAASTASKVKATETPKDVGPYDILCGRSKICFNNIGNRRFRVTIGMNVKKYDACPNRTERGRFIVKLSHTLQSDVGYRFFRICKKNGKVELSDDEIRAKVGHALRDLSITFANAAEAASKQFSKFMETKTQSQATQSREPRIVSRRVTNDFDIDRKGKFSEIKTQATQGPKPRIVSPPAPIMRRVTNDFEIDRKGKFPETKTQATQGPKPRIVSPPAPILRRVTNDFEIDRKGKVTGLPQCPDIENMDTSETSSQETPMEIDFAPPDDMFFVSEDAPHSSKTPSEISTESTEKRVTFAETLVSDEWTIPRTPRDQVSSLFYSTTEETKTPEEGMTCGQPVPIEDSSPLESSVQKEKEVGGDDVYMMPLRFDEPEHHNTFDPILLDMLPSLLNDQRLASHLTWRIQ